MTRLDASQTPSSGGNLTASRTPLARLAGPLALAAGSLMVVVEVLIFPIVDRDDHVGTSTNTVYRISGVVYFVAFCLLILAVAAAYLWQADKAGRFGVVGVICGSRRSTSPTSLTPHPRFSTRIRRVSS